MSAEAMVRDGYADPTEASNLVLWQNALTQLEDNLEIYQGLADVSAQARELAMTWQAPTDLGPLPAELLPRARMLAMAQERAYRQLRGKSRTNRQETDLLRSVPGPSAAAVYLDVAG